MGVAKVESLLENVVLNLVEQVLHVCCYSLYWTRLLLKSVAAHHLDSSLLKVASAKHKAYRHTLKLVVGKLEARTLVLSVVILHADALRAELVDDRSELLGHGIQLLGILSYRDDNHLYRGELRRKYESVVVGVGHDERTDKTCRNAP